MKASLEQDPACTPLRPRQPAAQQQQKNSFLRLCRLVGGNWNRHDARELSVPSNYTLPSFYTACDQHMNNGHGGIDWTRIKAEVIKADDNRGQKGRRR